MSLLIKFVQDLWPTVRVPPCVVVGIGNFAVTQILTQNTLVALALSALSTAIVAYFAHKPKMIIAQAGADKTAMEGFSSVLEQNQKHSHEVFVILTDRISALNKMESLLTITKHKLVNEVQRLMWRNDLLEDMLKEREVRVPEFTPYSFAELTKQEDDIRGKIADLPEIA